MSDNMEIVCVARGEGKTTRAITIAAERFAYLVVRNRSEADRVFHLARQAGKDIPFPLTYDEFVGQRFVGRGIRAFVVDDADDLVRYIARGVPVAAVTLTAPSANDGEPR